MNYQKPLITRVLYALHAVRGFEKLQFVRYDCILLIPFFASVAAYETDE
jgi:hypothetical protein